MSIFTFRVTNTLDEIPGAPGESVVIRKLNPRQLDAAKKEAQRLAMAEVKDLGVAFIKELRTLHPDEVKEAAAADPLLTHDASTLIGKGVLSWTLGEPLSSESIEELDTDAQDYLARAILRLSNPKLFMTPDAQEAVAKNA